jgi:hypothetical protein
MPAPSFDGVLARPSFPEAPRNQFVFACDPRQVPLKWTTNQSFPSCDLLICSSTSLLQIHAYTSPAQMRGNSSPHRLIEVVEIRMNLHFVIPVEC